ncbi:MAG: Mss4-like protein [Olpidium bornovanus]|uniref:Mss4-like protein n=1 Tax=Olpidium bornovanus TaxID=278681 RepID=A0A8H7ZVS8_9FUNG|nr:MAG: Mss4-like protein [Olpidium bornovanus]
MICPAERYPDHAALFWMVENMLAFENVGFSKPVPAEPGAEGGAPPSPVVRFLACADCDHGPIGYHLDGAGAAAGAGGGGDPPGVGRKQYLVAVGSVRYADAGAGPAKRT